MVDNSSYGVWGGKWWALVSGMTRQASKLRIGQAGRSGPVSEQIARRTKNIINMEVQRYQKQLFVLCTIPSPKLMFWMDLEFARVISENGWL